MTLVCLKLIFESLLAIFWLSPWCQAVKIND